MNQSPGESSADSFADAPAYDFSDKAVLVTGAGRGLGREVALALARAGAKVALLARTHDELVATAETIRSAGGVAAVVQNDLSELGQLPGALARAQDSIGPIDVLINNAAVIWPFKPSRALDPAEWAAAITINFTAAAALSFGVLPAMLDRGCGRILNVTSPSVQYPKFLLGANAYIASKAGLEAHTVNLAAELADTGVLVNAYRPGSVETSMQQWMRDQDPSDIGAELHAYFVRHHEEGAAITAERTAKNLVDRLAEPGTGQIWDFQLDLDELTS